MFTSLPGSSTILFSLRKSLIGLALNHHQPNRQFLRYLVESFNLGRNPCQNRKGLIRIQRLMPSMRSISHVPGKEAAPAVAAEEEERVLVGRDDAYDGVIVEMKEKMEADAFVSLLRASLSKWRGMGKKGVWIKLPIKLANLVEAAVNEGFYYHHAEPKYLMLVNWLSECPSTLPANATHRVGVGAFVINDRQEVLVVQEKNGILGGMGVWKFPTGIADEGEDISVAAVREVKEETGIDARFVEILTFRQSHQSFFQKSDLYFVCMLEPLSFDIQVQESELEAAKWMPFEEYAAQPFVQKHELLKNTVQICQAKMNRTYSGFAKVPIQASFREGKDAMYLKSHADID